MYFCVSPHQFLHYVYTHSPSTQLLLSIAHSSLSLSLSCSLPPQLSLLSDAGATPLILPAAAWWRTVTDRVALPLYPAVLKWWYIHLHGLITTWHVHHLQQTLSWQQSTKRSMGCVLISKWNKSNSTLKKDDMRENTHQWLHQFSHSWGHNMRSKVTSCSRELKAWFKWEMMFPKCFPNYFHFVE